ncbi:hypothetical protein EDB85DRAFT_2153064 [Lactarius pseudohatsudake]|nr:hypothetical protein EDB85DRAFT_2153064 [Lactarius pseudohatsudake]
MTYVKHHYSRYAFKHVARIDVPTFMDPSVSQRLDAVSPRYDFCMVGRTLDSLLRAYAVTTQNEDYVKMEGLSSNLSAIENTVRK